MTNPLPIEEALLASCAEHVAKLCVIGKQRASPYVVLQPCNPAAYATDMSRTHVARAVHALNTTLPSYSRIPQHALLWLGSDEPPLATSAKGNVIRGEAERRFAERMVMPSRAEVDEGGEDSISLTVSATRRSVATDDTPMTAARGHMMFVCMLGVMLHHFTTPLWQKQPTLALMAETFMQLKECNVIAFADADMLLMNGTMQSQQVKAWLADDEQFFFIAKESGGGWTRGSAKDAHGRNNLANSQVSTGLMLAKRDPRTFAMLAKWWCSSEEPCDTSSATEQRGCYRYDWAHEQRMIDNEFFSESADELGKALRRGMRSSDRDSDYNTPWGRHARHFWFKDSDNLAFTTAFARRIAKNAPETCAKATRRRAPETSRSTTAAAPAVQTSATTARPIFPRKNSKPMKAATTIAPTGRWNVAKARSGGDCRPWCAGNTKPWRQKCTFSGCTTCDACAKPK